MDWLLFDTDVISYGIKKDSRAELYEHLVRGHVNCISFMSVAELELWSLRDGLGPVRLRDLKQKLDTMMIPLQSTRKMARIWAEITSSVQKQGRHIACADT